MHPLDIALAKSGGPFSASEAGTRSVAASDVQAVLPSRRTTRAIAIDQPLTPGEILPIAGGIEVIHTPGHCAGQVALLWRPGRMLFAGSVCMNVMGLGDPVGFESLKEGRASQRKVASLAFDAAGFGNGEPIVRDPSTRFRKLRDHYPPQTNILKSRRRG
jgi:glyoxylase-like metal-dependent hydrolase (beta-lactamase superfamily II)